MVKACACQCQKRQECQLGRRRDLPTVSDSSPTNGHCTAPGVVLQLSRPRAGSHLGELPSLLVKGEGRTPCVACDAHTAKDALRGRRRLNTAVYSSVGEYANELASTGKVTNQHGQPKEVKPSCFLIFCFVWVIQPRNSRQCRICLGVFWGGGSPRERGTRRKLSET